MEEDMASRSHPYTDAKSARTEAEPSAGFTPGPWGMCLHLRANADETCGCGYRGGIWGADGAAIICEMGGTTVVGEEGLEPPRYPRHTEKANARLIAAAPELYASLRAIRDAWEQEGATDHLIRESALVLSKAKGAA